MWIFGICILCQSGMLLHFNPQVGSHYHFLEANKQLEFDRAAAYGMRLVRLTLNLEVMNM